MNDTNNTPKQTLQAIANQAVASGAPVTQLPPGVARGVAAPPAVVARGPITEPPAPSKDKPKDKPASKKAPTKKAEDSKPSAKKAEGQKKLTVVRGGGKFAETSKITLGKDKNGVKYGPENNPKQRTAATRFAFYKDGMTVGQYVAACKKAGFTAEKAQRDLAWDSKYPRAWIKIA